MAADGGSSLIERFAALADPRQTAKVLYPLPEILLLLLSATLAGADDFVEIELRGEENLPFPRRLLPFTHGIPSHDGVGGGVGRRGCAPRPPTWPGPKPGRR